jgi:hypothetical protein
VKILAALAASALLGAAGAIAAAYRLIDQRRP